MSRKAVKCPECGSRRTQPFRLQHGYHVVCRDCYHCREGEELPALTKKAAIGAWNAYAASGRSPSAKPNTFFPTEAATPDKIEAKLRTLEARPARFDAEKVAARLDDLRNAFAISVVSGVGEFTPTGDRVLKLLASGRINAEGHLQLCLAMSRAAFPTTPDPV